MKSRLLSSSSHISVKESREATHSMTAAAEGDEHEVDDDPFCEREREEKIIE